MHTLRKYLFLFSILSVVVAPMTTPAVADESSKGNRNGIGFILGEPSGISLQLGTQSTNTVNTGLAFSFDHWFQVWADYAFHFPRFVSDLTKNPSSIDSYIGVGGGLVFASSKHFSNSFGALFRVPFGLEYKLSTAPFGFFLELVPGMLIGPATRGEFQGGIGVRYLF